MTGRPETSRSTCRAWPQSMGDGIWQAVCVVCGWRGEATSDVAATWEANNHGPKPSSLSLDMQRTSPVAQPDCPDCRRWNEMAGAEDLMCSACSRDLVGHDRDDFGGETP